MAGLKYISYVNILIVVYIFLESELQIINMCISGPWPYYIEICIPDTFFGLRKEWAYG